MIKTNIVITDSQQYNKGRGIHNFFGSIRIFPQVHPIQQQSDDGKKWKGGWGRRKDFFVPKYYKSSTLLLTKKRCWWNIRTLYKHNYEEYPRNSEVLHNSLSLLSKTWEWTIVPTLIMTVFPDVLSAQREKYECLTYDDKHYVLS